MSTSYPYLALARRDGLDYGDVLSAADACRDAILRDVSVHDHQQGATFWQRRGLDAVSTRPGAFLTIYDWVSREKWRPLR